MKNLRGIAASSGIAIGPAFLYRVEIPEVETRNDVDGEAELRRFESSVEEVQSHLAEVEKSKQGHLDNEDFEILEVQRVLLSDEEYGDIIRKRIVEDPMNAEAAVKIVTDSVVEEFSTLEDEYFRQRAADVTDLGNRLQRRLLGIADVDLSEITDPVVLIAHDLSPSDTIGLDLSKVQAMCTEAGSSTSHTAIVARSLGIPAVVGIGATQIDNRTTLILDGDAGICIVDPDDETLREYEKRKDADERRREELQRHAAEPAVTADGSRIECVANLGAVAAAERARDLGAEGVGLLRSEFLYLERAELPNEDEQYDAYVRISETFNGRPIIVRTLDVGGDKELPSIQMAAEQNPFLGHRAIRLTLDKPELFDPQMKALLRAGGGRDVRIMLPFISTLPELLRARGRISELHAELKGEGIPVADSPKVGIMIEIPSAAIMAPVLARHVDFFSIGTNDLCQYTMAAGRTNETVAPLANFFDPGVLFLIKRSIDAAHANGIEVAMCGEMAGSREATPLLIGLGLTEFSMSASRIPDIKATIRTLSYEACKPVAEACLNCSDADEVRRLLSEFHDSSGLQDPQS